MRQAWTEVAFVPFEDELTAAVQWLCSDAASFVTGIVLPIDGGFSAFSGV